jgi:8-oxo-dGTP pyrophosphatase MutT (NUDIX family)
VTGSALVLDVRRREVLLHRHRRLGIWLQPGGHVEAGEAPEAAALRETVEETGTAVTHPPDGPLVVHVDEHPGPDGHVHLDLRYLLLADRDAERLGPGEAAASGDAGAELRWADGAALVRVADRSLLRAVHALGQHGGPVIAREHVDGVRG